MTIPQYIIILLFVLCTFLLTRSHYSDKWSGRVIELQDSAISRERRARVELIAEYQTRIDSLVNAANTSITKARSNVSYYKSIPARMAAISDSVTAFTDDELRRAFADFR